MTRDEMLDFLDSISFRAQCTVVTMDMGFEYEYANNTGHGVGFGNMFSWPLRKFKPIKKEVFDTIVDKIANKELDESDLEDTSLHGLYEHMVDRGYNIENLSEIFAGLQNIVVPENEDFYCMCDIGKYEDPVFYTDEGSMLDDFEIEYCDYYNDWEELDDDDLEEWVVALKDGFGEIEYIEYE